MSSPVAAPASSSHRSRGIAFPPLTVEQNKALATTPAEELLSFRSFSPIR